jgi:MbtH protein
MSDPSDDILYFVVINDEEQYSIWQSYLPTPPGWRTIGEAQPKQACLDYIEANWTDMRPKSLREHMARQRTS